MSVHVVMLTSHKVSQYIHTVEYTHNTVNGNSRVNRVNTDIRLHGVNINTRLHGVIVNTRLRGVIRLQGVNANANKTERS